MEALLAVVVGALFAGGVFLLLRGDLLRQVFGLVLLSNGANLLFFTAGRLTRGNPPLIPVGADAPVGVVANPLAQALVLTAIVIGFGLISFTLVLAYRSYRTFGTMDPDPVDPPAAPPPPTVRTEPPSTATIAAPRRVRVGLAERGIRQRRAMARLRHENTTTREDERKELVNR